jgi:hypothetical protein
MVVMAGGEITIDGCLTDQRKGYIDGRRKMCMIAVQKDQR